MLETPAQSVRAERSPFIGRDEELAAARRLLDAAGGARGRFVLLGGEAGVGKSRLCDEVVAQAEAAGFVTLTGGCSEGEAPVPFLPFFEILEASTRALPPEALRAALGESAAQLAAIAPHLRTAFPDIAAMPAYPPEHERHYLFSAVRDFLDRVSAQAPLVVIFEDVHWADAPTLLLIRHLIQFVSSRRVLIIVTYRPFEAESGDGGDGGATPLGLLISQVRRSRGGTIVQLDELAEYEVAALVGAVAGKKPTPEVAHAIYGRAGGNPFFIEQTVQHLSEEGRLLDAAGEWLRPSADDEPGVPEGIRLLIERRLGRVGETCRSMLVAAAAIGPSFQYEILAPVTAVDTGELLATLDAAERARLIRAGRDGFSFTHDLIRQTLLAQTSVPRRQQLHARIAAAIEETSRDTRDEHASELAYHYLHAGPAADRDLTVRYLLLAAERSMATTAYEKAADLYESALSVASPGDPRARCGLLLNAAEARKRVSDSQAARAGFGEAARLARELGDDALLVRAALGFAHSWPTIGTVDAEAVALLQTALPAIPEDDLALRSRVLSRLTLQLLYSGDVAQVEDLARQAVDVARRSGDAMTLARALQVLHAALWQPRHLDERLEVATETLSLAARIGDRAVALWGQRPRIADLAELGRMDEAEAEIDAYERLAADVGQPIYVWQAAVRRAMLVIFKGQLDEGERLAQRSLELGQRAEGQNLIAAFGGQLLVIRWQQGRLEELRPLITTSRKNQPETKLWSAVLAFIESESGNIAAVRDEFETLASDRFAGLPNEDTRLVVLVVASLVCAALGDGIRAEQLYEILLPYDGRNIVVSEGVACVGAASHYLGLLAATARRWDAAAQHFEAAIEMNTRIGGRPWLAHAEYEFARLLLTRRRPGDRKRAGELTRSALGIARDAGMRGLQDKIEALLRSHRRLTPEHPDGLTAREIAVLRLIAGGLSTREISEQLVLSSRTTSRHITNIYAKIGVRNRVEASAYALRHKIAG